MPHGKNTVLQTGICLSSILPYNIVIVIGKLFKALNNQQTLRRLTRICILYGK